jgi:hypothetical protein
LQSLIDDAKKERETKDTGVAKQFQESLTAVTSDIDKNLELMILKDFDPNKVFSKFMRRQLAQEVSKRIKNQLQSDNGHMTVMAARWKRAKDNGYTSDDKSKIVSTFLARAKSLIAPTSEKVRSLALGKAKKSSDEKVKRLLPDKREVNGGRVSSTKSTDKLDYRKLSDMDILALD